MTEPLMTNVLAALSDLLHELVDGPPASASYVLNEGDRGLLKSLDRLTAEEASRVAPGAATSIAAHVDHVRYGISLFNRWAGGERNPFATADWGASWKQTSVSDAEWVSLREQVAAEAHSWATAIQTPRRLDEVALRGIIASVVHLGYHLGAIRQLDQKLRGPREGER